MAATLAQPDSLLPSPVVPAIASTPPAAASGAPSFSCDRQNPHAGQQRQDGFSGGDRRIFSVSFRLSEGNCISAAFVLHLLQLVTGLFSLYWFLSSASGSNRNVVIDIIRLLGSRIGGIHVSGSELHSCQTNNPTHWAAISGILVTIFNVTVTITSS